MRQHETRAGRPGDGPTIAFARSDLTIPWSSDYGTLLELAESCDVPVRWASSATRIVPPLPVSSCQAAAMSGATRWSRSAWASSSSPATWSRIVVSVANDPEHKRVVFSVAE